MFDKIRTSFRDGLKTLRDEESRLRAQLETARRRREDLLTLKLAKADVVALLVGMVDSKAERYPATLRAAIEGLINSTQTKRDKLGVAIQVRGGIFSPIKSSGQSTVAGPEHLEVGFCYLFREQIKAAVAQAVEGMDWPAEVGPPPAQRTEELRQLDAQSQRIEAEIVVIEETRNQARA